VDKELRRSGSSYLLRRWKHFNLSAKSEAARSGGMNEETTMIRRDYPETVIEVVDADMRFKPAALQAVRRFAESHPWRGSLEERKVKFLVLNRALAKAYGVEEPTLHFGRMDGGSSGGSYYVPALHRITLVGRLSVVTFLHEFGHARGMGERGACRWSINIFRRCFPREYARLVGRGHMLIAPASVSRDSSRVTRPEGK
jgi:hypothetical protein